jgi:phage baseplate assembly protein W
MSDLEQTVQAALRRALGWDLASNRVSADDLGRDLELEAGPGGIDLVRVEGPDNLEQQLALALTTSLGEDVLNTDYGFDGLRALAEETIPLLQRERIRIAVIRVVTRDPRVRRVVDVELGDQDRDVLVPPRAGDRVLSVRVVFETVSGGTHAVTVGSME